MRHSRQQGQDADYCCPGTPVQGAQKYAVFLVAGAKWEVKQAMTYLINHGQR